MGEKGSGFGRSKYVSDEIIDNNNSASAEIDSLFKRVQLGSPTTLQELAVLRQTFDSRFATASRLQLAHELSTMPRDSLENFREIVEKIEKTAEKLSLAVECPITKRHASLLVRLNNETVPARPEIVYSVADGHGKHFVTLASREVNSPSLVPIKVDSSGFKERHISTTTSEVHR